MQWFLEDPIEISKKAMFNIKANNKNPFAIYNKLRIYLMFLFNALSFLSFLAKIFQFAKFIIRNRFAKQLTFTGGFGIKSLANKIYTIDN